MIGLKIGATSFILICVVVFALWQIFSDQHHDKIQISALFKTIETVLFTALFVGIPSGLIYWIWTE